MLIGCLAAFWTMRLLICVARLVRCVAGHAGACLALWLSLLPTRAPFTKGRVACCCCVGAALCFLAVAVTCEDKFYFHPIHYFTVLFILGNPSLSLALFASMGYFYPSLK